MSPQKYLQMAPGNFMLGCVVVWVLLASAVFGGSLLDEAVESYRQGELSHAQKVLEDILSRPAPQNEDAAMFLLIRVHLARSDGTREAELAERFLTRFPESSYFDDVHYARAEAFFLRKELIACAQELLWVVQKASDSRLREKALQVLPLLAKESRTARERNRVEEIAASLLPVQPKIPKGAVVVLLAFPEEDAPEAHALRQSFEFAARRGSLRFPIVFQEVTSSFECVQIAQNILADKTVQLLVYAGDEGSATALSLLCDQQKVPLFLLTAYAYSLTALSEFVFEFLPNRQTQGFALGEFAIKELEVRSALELMVSDEEGHALETGFRSAIESAGGTVEATEWYSPTAPSVRALLRELFSSSRREEQEKGSLSAAVTDSEMTALWGTTTGEVLLLKPIEEDSMQEPPPLKSGQKAFFFGIPSGRAEDLASQMGSLPRRTILLGNSAWIDLAALSKFPEICDGMVVAAPLSPNVEIFGLLQQLYEDSVGRSASLWELLGMDAAAFIGTILTNQPDSRNEMREALLKAEPFSGLSVRLDFQGGRQNRAVRILRYEQENFEILK